MLPLSCTLQLQSMPRENNDQDQHFSKAFLYVLHRMTIDVAGLITIACPAFHVV